MTTTTTPALPAVGVTARFDLDNGDSYIGEIVETHGNTAHGTIVLRNYSAWYADENGPWSSENYDDEVQFGIDVKTVIELF